MLTYSITLTIKDNGKEVSSHRSGKRKRIYYFLQEAGCENPSYHVRVTYSDGKKNVGEYKTKKDTVHALGAFTEKGLLKE